MNQKKFKVNNSMAAMILTLAWPTMLEQLMQTAVQYIDTAMVGSLGTYATAAVGATSTVSWVVGSSISALGIGFLSFIARANGAGERESAKRASAQAALIVVIIGCLFTAICLSCARLIPSWMQVDASILTLTSQYFAILYSPMLFRTATIVFGMVLRAAGDTKTPMKVAFGVNIVNVLLNFLLIYPSRQLSLFGIYLPMPGAGLEVIGAAIASAVAFTIGGIWITIVLWKHSDISPKGQRFYPDPAILRPCLRVAFPNMLQRFGTSLGYVAFASMVNSIGEVATAAHTIANTVESAFYIPGYGMQTAAATLAGNAYGAKDQKHMKELGRIFLPVEVILMIISGSLLFVLAPTLVDFFSDNPQVISLGSRVLRMVAVSEPFYGVSIIVEGMMQGVGKTRIPFTYNIIGMWGVRIIGTYICTQTFSLGLVSAWGCMIAHNMLLFALFLFTYLQGKWNPLSSQNKANR